MRRVARREPDAQRELAERLVLRVRRLSYVLLQDPTEADDAAQQSLVEILQSAHSFSAPGNLEAWADTITVRTVYRIARRLNAQRSRFLQFVDLEAISSKMSDLSGRAATPRQLNAYLSRIPPLKREAFVLKHALGYTVGEIAELTETPRGTVKDRLVAARKLLRKMVTREMKRVARSHGVKP
jgi:RNA polymerase sigma-70 factor (ECF subfamily)